MKGTMLPSHTRPAAPSPRARRSSSAQRQATSSRNPHEEGGEIAEGDTEKSASLNVQATVREYERARSELSRMYAQSRQLRERSNNLRQSIETFMRARNLERIRTKNGDIVIKFVDRSNRVRPSRRDTEKCILEALGPERSDVADRLINDLFEANKRKRRVTKVFMAT
jgi:hypothetical protein